jgi:hypothetical protein
MGRCGRRFFYNDVFLVFSNMFNVIIQKIVPGTEAPAIQSRLNNRGFVMLIGDHRVR